jgi:photosystem II stability/assembly factor-like uncharacterized protein
MPERILLIASISAAAWLASPSRPQIHWQRQASGVTSRLRGVSAVSTRIAWASGASGTVLRTTDGGATWQPRPIPGTAALDFRDVDAMSDTVAFTLSIGPGESSRIYKTTDGGEHWTLQFANTDPQVFLDAMAFWDADHGIAVSDSVGGAFVVLTTADGGRGWTRVPADRLPPARAGEGAFAASGTNVAVIRGHCWIATGASRVLHSADSGRSWTIAQTPVRTSESSGLFSVAFRDPHHGVVAGGDYRRETDGVDNVASTTDGGATWIRSAPGVTGYRSVVAWVPGTRGTFVAGGPSGVDWSTDDGRSWTPAAESTGIDTLSFAPGTRTGWAAGDHGRLVRLVIQD